MHSGQRQQVMQAVRHSHLYLYPAQVGGFGDLGVLKQCCSYRAA